MPYELQLEYKGFYAGLMGYYIRTGKGLELLTPDYTSQDNRDFRMYYAGYEQEVWAPVKLRVKAEFQYTVERFWGTNVQFTLGPATQAGIFWQLGRERRSRAPRDRFYVAISTIVSRLFTAKKTPMVRSATRRSCKAPRSRSITVGTTSRSWLATRSTSKMSSVSLRSRKTSRHLLR